MWRRKLQRRVRSIKRRKLLSRLAPSQILNYTGFISKHCSCFVGKESPKYIHSLGTVSILLSAEGLPSKTAATRTKGSKGEPQQNVSTGVNGLQFITAGICVEDSLDLTSYAETSWCCSLCACRSRRFQVRHLRHNMAMLPRLDRS
jgi:hypothetical protein